MEKRILLESTPGQQRLAVLEDGALVELHVRRDSTSGGVGRILLGRVENLVPGIDAAFVDIGEEKNAYLSAKDCLKPNGKPAGDKARIDALLRPGQEILVQVVKEPGGTKGCRVSMSPTLPGRLCVLKPLSGGVSISRKIASEDERERLKRIAEECLKNTSYGAILRTAAEGATYEALYADLTKLMQLWSALKLKADVTEAPVCLYGETSLAAIATRDLLTGGVAEVATDDEALFDALRECMEDVDAEQRVPVRLHGGTLPLFDAWRVDRQLEKALDRLVWLDNGGSIVVDETEAMTVIDVNTGKFTGKRHLEDTVLQMNQAAAKEIARQLRLRDLGGIIVVDFIDMDEEADREALVGTLREEVSRDRNQVTIHGFTQLGLMELTRKKIRTPLTKQLMHLCEDCRGTGFVPSHETTACEALREVWTRAKTSKHTRYSLTAMKPVIDWVRTIGAPEGVALEVEADERMGAGQYRVEAE